MASFESCNLELMLSENPAIADGVDVLSGDECKKTSLSRNNHYQL